jgi:hypothetical protein
MNVDNNAVKVNTSQFDKGQARITCPYQLANGLDTLKLSFWVKWDSDDFLNELETHKKMIQSTSNAQSIPYHCPGNFDWNIFRTGTTLYPYRLLSGDITFLLNNRESDGNIPNVRLEIGSQSCWMPGYKEIYGRFIRWIEVLGGKIAKEIVSEVHLAVDVIGLDINDLTIHDQELWISQVKDFNVYRHARKITGITIGKGKTMLRIYDKVHELRFSTHKQETCAEIWKTGSYDRKPVTRIEFQVRREVLKDFRITSESLTGIDTFRDLCNTQQSIWAYCTQLWSRHILAPIDHENNHQSRAGLSDFWKIVISVEWAGSDQFSKQKARPNKSLDRLRKQFAGIAMTIAAFDRASSDDIDHVLGISKKILDAELMDLYIEDKDEFAKRMDRKKREIFDSISAPCHHADEYFPESITPPPLDFEEVLHA